MGVSAWRTNTWDAKPGEQLALHFLCHVPVDDWWGFRFTPHGPIIIAEVTVRGLPVPGLPKRASEYTAVTIPPTRTGDTVRLLVRSLLREPCSFVVQLLRRSDIR